MAPLMMSCAVILILTSSFLSWSSALYSTNREDSHTAAAVPKKLQYLLEPPVFAEVIGRRGENVTLPCILKTQPKNYKVKWTKVEPERVGLENIVMMLNANAFKPYGLLGQRASLRRAHAMDASLLLRHLELDDGGQYRCELINGIEDENVVITLRIEGVVFPYQSKHGRYMFTYPEAKDACVKQDGKLATYDQLYRAWTEGLDWCNAGWLHDGTVHYPIIRPRPVCGGELLPGIRSYGPKDKSHDRFDAFCFTSQNNGKIEENLRFGTLSKQFAGSVFYISGALSYDQAEHACRARGSELALVGQLYAAWRFQNYDRCDGGWLKDGSVRFPISNPRNRCGGVAEAGVRTFGFPNKMTHLYGAYCYR